MNAHLMLHALLADSQLDISEITALYSFSDSIQLVLRRLDIKPHWISSSLSVLSPDLSVLLHVDDIPSPSTAAPTGQRTSLSRESGPSEVELPESRPPSREDARRETRNELRGLQHDNDHLIEQLIAAERDLNEQLKSEVNRANRLREMCSFRHTYPPTTAPTKIILPNSTHYSRATEDLIQWLKSLDIDDRSVRAIMNEGYTKTDILELVSREELLNIGVSGGASCRIWRVACDTRERARRQPVYLSPMRSRDASLDDYHSSVADENYTITDLN